MPCRTDDGLDAAPLIIDRGPAPIDRPIRSLDQHQAMEDYQYHPAKSIFDFRNLT